MINELRTLSYLLHPPLLDELGLIPSLQWFVRRFSERSGIQVELQIAGQIGRFPADIETALFRVAQESLSNVDRHSGSRVAGIQVTQTDGSLVLQVKDEGSGFPGGLPSINEIESGQQGTTVTARIPIRKKSCAAHSNCG